MVGTPHVYKCSNGEIRLTWKNPGTERSAGAISQTQYVSKVDNISFELKTLVAEPVTIALLLRNSSNNRYQAPVEFPVGTDWKRVTVRPDDFKDYSLWDPFSPVPKGQEMMDIALEVSGPSGARCDLMLRDFVVTAADGKKITLMDPYTLRDVYGNIEEYPALPIRLQDDHLPRVFVAGVTVTSPAWQNGLAKLKKKFGDALAVHVSYPLYPRLGEGFEVMQKLGLKTTMESHQAVGYVDYLTNHKAYLTNETGVTINDPKQWERTDNFYPWPVHGLDYTRPEEVMVNIKATVERAARLGISEYFDVDFVWPWQGRWGYGEATVANFRKDLLGTDAGLEFEYEPGQAKRIGFWDYIALFTDIRFTPEMAGCPGGSWNTYFPTREAIAAKGSKQEQCNLFLFLSLYHYEVLKFLQQEGKICEAAGIRFVSGSNPEDIFNGNDVYFAGRLPGISKYGYLFFGAPFGTLAWYHNMQFYSGNLKRFNRDIYLVGEIYLGGHGASLYDAEAAYAFYYDITSAAKPSDYNNQYVEGHVWDGAPALDEYSQNRYGHWAAGAFAFLQSHAERPGLQNPKSTVVIGSRNILEYQDGFANSMTQVNNLAYLLDQLHYPFDSAGKEGLTDGFIKNAKLLVYTPSQSSPMHLKAARDWLAGAPDHTLLTHSSVPFLLFDGGVQLDRGVQGVNWEEGKSYSRFQTQQIQKGADLLLQLERVVAKKPVRIADGAKTLSATRDIYFVRGQKVLMTDLDGTPLISEVKTPKGRIVYINCTMPHYDTEEFSRVVLQSAMTKAGATQEAIANPETAVHLYDVAGGRSMVLWNIPHLTRQHTSQPRLFRRDPLPELPVSVKVAPGKYTVYNFYANSEKLQSVGENGMLPLVQRGTCDIFYFGFADDPEFQKTLESVRKARQELSELDYKRFLQQAEPKATLIYENGFEQGDAMPQDWSTWFPQEYIKNGIAPENVFSGTRAISLKSPENPDHRWFASFKLDPSRKYLLKAKVKTQNCSPTQFAQLRLEQIHNGQFFSAVYGEPILGNTNGWQDLQLLFQPLTENINILLVFGSHTGSAPNASAIFDDVKLYELAE